MIHRNTPRPLWRTLRAIAQSESLALRAWAQHGRTPKHVQTRWDWS